MPDEPDEPDELDEIFDAYEDAEARMARELEERHQAIARFTQAFTEWVDNVAVPTLDPFIQRVRHRSHEADLSIGESRPRVDDGSLVLTLSPGPQRNASRRLAFFAHGDREIVSVETPAGGGAITRNEYELGQLTPKVVQSAAFEAIMNAFAS